MYSFQLSHVSPTMPAIRSMLTFGKSGVCDPLPRLVDFAREVGPAVLFQDRVAEVLDAQAQPRDAQLLERLRPSAAQSVPGSHSNVTSSAWSQLTFARSRSTSDVSCLAD